MQTNVGRLRRANTLSEFLASPSGAFLVGDSFLYFQACDQTSGFSLWGTPSSDDLRMLTHAMESTVSLGASDASIVDASGLLGVNAAAYSALWSSLEPRFPGLCRAIRKQVVLRPDGLPGAVVAGFYELLAPPYPAKVFADSGLALEWLGRPGLRATIDSLQQLVSDERRTGPLLNRLRSGLDTAVGNRALGLKATARNLGVSNRSLQRRLQLGNTSFRVEVERSRIRLAKQLMFETNASLSAIAFDIGCPSASHFSSMFRRATGMTPTQWRLLERQQESAVLRPKRRDFET